PDGGAEVSVHSRRLDALNFIDGKHVPAAEWLDNFEPAAGAPYGRVASSDASDVERAVAAARRAFPVWSATPAAQRSRLLRTVARLIERDRDRLARAESVDTGKPLSLAASVDIPRGLCAEAGLPPGTLNIVQGLGPRAGAALVAHPQIRALSFTGSTRVGRELAAQTAQRFVKASLEMGGKNPNLIFADADLD